RGSSYLPFTRKRRQQNVIIPKKKKPAENIDGFVSGLRPANAGLFCIFPVSAGRVVHPLFDRWTALVA
ncbi:MULTISPECIES: hypothetical protein, partial [Agrobacterium]|uniref:hypothetical protein n=1 Tax=Agrobacterium TaxID=357 RepID=UPI00195D4A1F